MKHATVVGLSLLFCLLLPGFLLAQDSLNVQLIGFYLSSGTATDVVVSDRIAYLADWEQGVALVDVSDPTAPEELAVVPTTGEADDADVYGSLMAIADRTRGLVLVDVSDPENPTEVGVTSIRGYANALASGEDLVYFADGNNGLGIYDVSDPESPFETGFSGSGYTSLDICISGSFAYTSDGSTGIHIFSITDPSAPEELVSYDPPSAGAIFTVGVDDGVVGMTDNTSTFYLANTRRLTQISLIGSVSLPSSQSVGCEVVGDYAYIANQTGGLQIVSFVDRQNLYIAGSYSLPELDAKGVDVVDGLIYVAGGAGLYIFRFEDPDAVPDLEYYSHYVEDSGQAHPNGFPDPGETVALNVGLHNGSSSQSITSVQGVLSCDHEDILNDDGTAVWADIEPGFTEYNGDDLLVVTIPETFSPATVTFQLDLTFNGSEQVAITFTQMVGSPDLALVNDYGDGDNVDAVWHQIFQTAALDAQILTSSSAVQNGLAGFRNVIWTTSNDSGDVLTEAEVSLIQNYLSNGGSLLLTSSNVGEDEGSAQWFDESFTAHHLANTVESPYVLGVDSGPMGAVALSLVGDGGAGNSSSPSSIQALEGAELLYRYSVGSATAGVAHTGEGYAAIYLAFALEAVTGSDNTQTAAEALADLLAYMDSVNGVEQEIVNSALPASIQLEAWPNPFNASLQIRYQITQPGNLNIELFDLLGRHVRTLYSSPSATGTGAVRWQADHVASGTYLIRLSSDFGVVTRRVQLVK